MNSSLLEPLAEFAAKQIATQDIDPLYPVLREVERDMEPEQAVWYSLLYVAYYNIASADRAWQEATWPQALPYLVWKLPTGTERRNLRGGLVAKHVNSLVSTSHAHPEAWLRDGLTDDPWQNWDIATFRLTSLWGNGRWACYKTCEVLQKVNGFPLRASDMGNAWSSGPRKGLALFFGPVSGNDDRAVKLLDAQAVQLQRALWERGVPLEIEELETVLCDFHSMQRGKYYPGHDIDELGHVLVGARRELQVAAQRALF